MTSRGEAISLAKRRHGHARRTGQSADYQTWASMIRRCHNPRQTSYRNYGARGTVVADEWLGEGGFERFMSHIGPRPSDAHTIDRIDNSKGYEPGNVRWATPMEQGRNRTNNRWIEANGERLHVAEWARRLGTSPQNIFTRINRYGWDPVKAVTTPARPVPGRRRTTHLQNRAFE